MIIQNRRRFLKSVGASAMSASAIGTINALSGFKAHAADTSGYKALVCVFLLGGLDNHDTLIPYDVPSYDRYAEIRAPLFNFYNSNPGGNSRDRARLLPLTPDNAADFGGREFALPEEMPGIHNLFQSGNAAIVANVGPLIQPVTQTEFFAESAPLPPRLFSHNDQQSTWQSSQPEGAAFGWGGLFADAALGGLNPTSAPFTTITTLGNELFLTGQQASPYQISTEGAVEVELLNILDGFRFTPEGEQAFQDLRTHFLATNFNGSNLIERDIATAAENSFLSNEQYNAALGSAVPLTTAFPMNFLGAQLSAVAQAISIRNILLTNRQIFFVAIGGFDTHSNQAQDLPGLQTEIDGAVTAFYDAMQELGVASDVTLFTASDFGRTLAINGDGTDHGWGAYHFVVGDAVQGRRIYGDPPIADFNHALDAGGGRLIPSISVEQMAEPLGRWFGLNDTEIANALPNLSNFSNPPLAFV